MINFQLHTSRVPDMKLSSVLVIVFFILNLLFSYTCITNSSSVQVGASSFHLIVSGVLYFIATITFIQFLFFKEATYLYYVLYVLINLCYFTLIFSSNPEISKKFPEWFRIMRYHLSLPLLAASYTVYILFAVYFLNLKPKDGFVYKWVLLSIKLYIVILFIALLLYFLPPSNAIVNVIRTVLLLACMPMGFVSILLVYIRIKNPIASILCIGSLCFFTGSVFGFLFSSEVLSYPSNTSPFNQWVFYTETGTLLEIVLFSSSFAYRNKILAAEEKKAQELVLIEVEKNKQKEKKLQLIRDEIARDLHDDIGASLSNINILNALAKRNSSNPDKANEYLDKASEDIQHVSESLSDIVWNINPKYDNPENLFIRLRRYAADMMDGKGISYEINFPENVSGIHFNMEKRRDFYLIYKEAINNLIKYSQAKKVVVHIKLSEENLHLSIADDGIGFDKETVINGNGLDNMKHRAGIWNAHLTILSKPGIGTTVELLLPLP